MNPTFYLLVLSTVGLWTASHVHCSYDPEPVSSDIIQQPDLNNTIITNIQTQSAPFSLKTTTPDSFPVAFTQRTARREVRAQGTVVREKAREEEGFSQSSSPLTPLVPSPLTPQPRASHFASCCTLYEDDRGQIFLFKHFL